MARDYRVVPGELTLRETTSEDVQFVLYQGTAPINLTSLGTVELWRRDKAGGTVMTDNLTGQLSINGAAGGSVKWTPGTANLNAGSAPYQAYFKVYRSASSQFYVPESYDLTISVREKF